MAELISHTLKDIFDNQKVSAFIFSTDPQDESEQRIIPQRGVRAMWDDGGVISKLYGAMSDQTYQPYTLVLDPMMRVIARLGHENAAQHEKLLRALIEQLPPIDDHAKVQICAPVLIVPRVFEPDFCRELIAYYEKGTPYESGFMRERDGKTVLVKDDSFKRRNDCDIEDEALKQAYRARLIRRLLPEIQRSFQFHVTHIERYIVARYDAEEKGFFRPHRDNTTKGTAHRKFACSINLNAEDFQGGNLRFPEFGTKTYRAPTGGAVVFSCSLLHEALPVTKGTRYATLPFFYDEAAAKIRRENLHYIEE